MIDDPLPQSPTSISWTQAVDLVQLLGVFEQRGEQRGIQQGTQESRVSTLEQEMREVKGNLQGINTHLATQDGTIAANHAEVVGHIDRLSQKMLDGFGTLSTEVGTLKRNRASDMPRINWVDDQMAADVAELKRHAEYRDMVLAVMVGLVVAAGPVVLGQVSGLPLSWSIGVAVVLILVLVGTLYRLFWRKRPTPDRTDPGP